MTLTNEVFPEAWREGQERFKQLSSIYLWRTCPYLQSYDADFCCLGEEEAMDRIRKSFWKLYGIKESLPGEPLKNGTK